VIPDPGTGTVIPDPGTGTVIPDPGTGTVIPDPGTGTVMVAPTAGTVGTVVTISGTGYGANDNITIAFGTNDNIQQAVADEYGSFTTSFTVDTQAYGTTTITVSGVGVTVFGLFTLEEPVDIATITIVCNVENSAVFFGGVEKGLILGGRLSFGINSLQKMLILVVEPGGQEKNISRYVMPGEGGEITITVTF